VERCGVLETTRTRTRRYSRGWWLQRNGVHPSREKT